MKFIVFILSFICWGVFAQAPHNFEQAKKAAKIIWEEQRETFYCACHYDKHGAVDFNSCGYTPSNIRKSRKISWEHVVPVSWYGRHLACWQGKACRAKKGTYYGGRKCCRKINRQFRQMEADLYNLVPAIREINTARSDYTFGEFSFIEKISNHFKSYGCQLMIDERHHVVEPRDEVKGMIARIHFYMAHKYGIPLNEQQLRLLGEWQQRFPPSEWEKKWIQKVAQWQEVNPPFLSVAATS